MEKHFVTYNQSLALKELGFDKPCLAVYAEGSKQLIINNTIRNWNDQLKNGNTTSAPLKSQVFEWGRKNQSIHGIVSYYGKGQWNIEILDYKGNELIQIEDNTFWSYEEAESACIDKLIEIVKKK